MGFNPLAQHASKIKKKGAYLRRARGTGRVYAVPVMYLVETRKPDLDTPAGLFWELHHFPHEWSQPREKKTHPPRP